MTDDYRYCELGCGRLAYPGSEFCLPCEYMGTPPPRELTTRERLAAMVLLAVFWVAVWVVM